MTDEIKSTIGKNLKAARWKHGWSQDFVSKQIGLSIRTISRAEMGCGLSKDTLKRLCTFYCLPVEQVYGCGTGQDTSRKSVDIIPDDIAIRILKSSSFIFDIQRESVLRYNASIQRNAVMCREQIEDILPTVIQEKKQYNIMDVIACCLEVNRITIKNIVELAIN